MLRQGDLLPEHPPLLMHCAPACCHVIAAHRQGEEFKHFDLKWKDYESMHWRPIDAAAEPKLDAALREAAGRAFVALRGCSYGRSDFRVDRQGARTVLSWVGLGVARAWASLRVTMDGIKGLQRH